jgi:hypothetical protein
MHENVFSCHHPGIPDLSSKPYVENTSTFERYITETELFKDFSYGSDILVISEALMLLRDELHFQFSRKFGKKKE